MQDYYSARAQLLAEISKTATQEIKAVTARNFVKLPLLEAIGLVVAKPLTVRIDSPAFDNSAMDGYAICNALTERLQFDVVGRIAAGEAAITLCLSEGQACRIFTGAAIPQGTTSVVMQENTQLLEGRLILQEISLPGQNIRFQAEELKQGQCLVEQGQIVNPALVALLASQGYMDVPVMVDQHAKSPLKVCVFSTGNELVEPSCDQFLNIGQIYDANRYQLLAWLRWLDVEATDGKILKDQRIMTQNQLQQAAQSHDVIILSGGASVGEEDHVKPALMAIGQLTSWRLAIKPGKPFGWGRIVKSQTKNLSQALDPDVDLETCINDDRNGKKADSYCYVFVLPGNPVAAYVTFYLLVYPMLLKMQGLDDTLSTRMLKADFEITRYESRREFLRGKVVRDSVTGTETVQILKSQGSAMLSALAVAEVLVEIPPQTLIKKGDWVNVFYLPQCKSNLA